MAFGVAGDGLPVGSGDRAPDVSGRGVDHLKGAVWADCTPPYETQSAPTSAIFRTDRRPFANPRTPRDRIARGPPASGLGPPDAVPEPVNPFPVGDFGEVLPEVLDNAMFLGRALFGEAARVRLPMPARAPSGHRAALGFPAEFAQQRASSTTVL